MRSFFRAGKSGWQRLGELQDARAVEAGALQFGVLQHLPFMIFENYSTAFSGLEIIRLENEGHASINLVPRCITPILNGLNLLNPIIESLPDAK